MSTAGFINVGRHDPVYVRADHVQVVYSRHEGWSTLLLYGGEEVDAYMTLDEAAELICRAIGEEPQP